MIGTITQLKIKDEIKLERPRLHKVILVNDDFTPREFVVRTRTDANGRPSSARAAWASTLPADGVSERRFCAMGGGAPLTSAGEVVARVGVSGGTVEQDVVILEAAIREV
jgi:hypothetical protein